MKLLNCAHCGGQATLYPPLVTRDITYVGCLQCGITSPGRYTDEEVIKIWNTRVNGWRPIDSAPREGAFLASDKVCVRECYYDYGKVGFDEFSEGKEDSYFKEFKATHWQPLPSPPTNEDNT